MSHTCPQCDQPCNCRGGEIRRSLCEHCDMAAEPNVRSVDTAPRFRHHERTKAPRRQTSRPSESCVGVDEHRTLAAILPWPVSTSTNHAGRTRGRPAWHACGRRCYQGNTAQHRSVGVPPERAEAGRDRCNTGPKVWLQDVLLGTGSVGVRGDFIPSPEFRAPLLTLTYVSRSCAGRAGHARQAVDKSIGSG